jgi:uncharacterized membrane protein YphA (DoxX/SURF4 family)
MQKVLSLGKWLFVLSFLLYTGLHFGLPQVGADMIPSFFPARLFLNYATGILVTAFIISCLIGKYDQLASVLMALYVLFMIFLIHIPRASESTNDMLNIFRNIMVIGALLMYAKSFSKDQFIKNLQ